MAAARPQLAVPDGGDRAHIGCPTAIVADFPRSLVAHPRDGAMRSSRPIRTSWSSSIAPASTSASARRGRRRKRRRSRSSTMSRRRSGPGGRARAPRMAPLRRPSPRHPAVRAGGAPAARRAADCTYVGHPLIERLGRAAAGAGRAGAARSGRAAELLVLPGSRRERGQAADRRVRRNGRPASRSAPGRSRWSCPPCRDLADEIRGARRGMAGDSRGSSKARPTSMPPSGAPTRRWPPPAP